MSNRRNCLLICPFCVTKVKLGSIDEHCRKICPRRRNFPEGFQKCSHSDCSERLALRDLRDHERQCIHRPSISCKPSPPPPDGTDGLNIKVESISRIDRDSERSSLSPMKYDVDSAYDRLYGYRDSDKFRSSNRSSYHHENRDYDDRKRKYDDYDWRRNDDYSYEDNRYGRRERGKKRDMNEYFASQHKKRKQHRMERLLRQAVVPVEIRAQVEYGMRCDEVQEAERRRERELATEAYDYGRAERPTPTEVPSTPVVAAPRDPRLNLSRVRGTAKPR